MDSDEEQLVIDEDLLVETNPPRSSPHVVQMEVADTSQEDSNGTESAQSETNSEKSTEPTETPKTKDAEKSSKHAKPSSSSSSIKHSSSSHKSSARKESSHDRHNSSSHKRHDRLKEHHRSHNEKEKKTSTSNNDTPKKYKKVSQTNWFKLSHLSDFAAKELNVCRRFRCFFLFFCFDSAKTIQHIKDFYYLFRFRP